MKKLLILFATVLCCHAIVNAKIRRVGFFASPISGTDYISFSAAYAAAANNDTILVFPNYTVSGTMEKKLTIIGPGNLLDPTTTPRGNANLQAFPGVASIGNLYFASGSSGSVVMGFLGGNIYIRESNITIKRNRDSEIYISSFSPAGSITNLQVLQNYHVGIRAQYTNGCSNTNLNFSNNFIYIFSLPTGNTYNGIISNNVWAYDATQTTNNLNGGAATLSYTGGVELGAGSWLLQNNIFLSYTNAAANSNYNYFIFENGGNSTFNYNLALQSLTPINWGAGTGNVITPISNAANIFNAFPLIASVSADARFQLKAGSPALTVGPGSTPIGMFTGNYPYKLSTIPTIPTIYSLSSPQGNNPTGSTMQINLSTRGNN